LLTRNPTIQTTIAMQMEKKSRPVEQITIERQANNMMFSRSPPIIRMGLVKLWNNGEYFFKLAIALHYR